MTDERRNEPTEFQGTGSANAENENTGTEDKKDKNLDKTLEDTFPASDPPSSIPDPEKEEEAA